jgi:hypothetical protein
MYIENMRQYMIFFMVVSQRKLPNLLNSSLLLRFLTSTWWDETCLLFIWNTKKKSSWKKIINKWYKNIRKEKINLWKTNLR